MLHLYVDPEGESYEKLYGPGKGGSQGGARVGPQRIPGILACYYATHRSMEPQRSPRGAQRFKKWPRRTPGILACYYGTHETTSKPAA